ncbi:MAG TPA: IPT/TIG domain-containing protein [Kofleriaceae bacterium]
MRWRGSAIAVALVSICACSASDDIPAPRIATISPDHGPAGAGVRITGEYFCQQLETEDPLACAQMGTVHFGTTIATLTTYTDSEVMAEVPAGTGNVRVTISVAGRISNGVTFTFE